MAPTTMLPGAGGDYGGVDALNGRQATEKKAAEAASGVDDEPLESGD